MEKRMNQSAENLWPNLRPHGPRHLGHVVGMTHAGTLAAPVPMKFLNTRGTFAAPI